MKTQKNLISIVIIFLITSGCINANAGMLNANGLLDFLSVPATEFKFKFQLNSINCTGQAAPLFGLNPEYQQTVSPIDPSLIEHLLKAESGYIGGHTVVAQPFGKVTQIGEPKEDVLVVTVVTSPSNSQDFSFPYKITTLIVGGKLDGFAGAQHGVQIETNTGTMENRDLSCDLSGK
ncbi:MAG: hypothetical protein V4654_12205 [Bdellovibrionota bacterium]